MNEKTHRAYSEKLQLKVLELEKTALATEEDRKWKLDIWGSFFKSSTWEELKALAEQLPILEEAAQTVYSVTRDEGIRQQCEAREEYYRIQRTNQLLMEMKDKKLEEQSKQLVEKDEALQKKDEVIQKKDEVIQKKDEALQKKDEQLKKIQKILISDAFQRGMSLEEAAAHTGLSVDEINHIKNQ